MPFLSRRKDKKYARAGIPHGRIRIVIKNFSVQEAGNRFSCEQSVRKFFAAKLSSVVECFGKMVAEKDAAFNGTGEEPVCIFGDSLRQFTETIRRQDVFGWAGARIKPGKVLFETQPLFCLFPFSLALIAFVMKETKIPAEVSDSRAEGTAANLLSAERFGNAGIERRERIAFFEAFYGKRREKFFGFSSSQVA